MNNLNHDLMSIPLFSGMSLVEKEHVLSYANRGRYQEGSVLINKGKTPRALFIISSGNVHIFNEDVLLAELGPYVIIGESIIAGTAATATIVATTIVETMEFDKDTYITLCQTYPKLVLNIFSSTMERLRHANENAMHEAHTREKRLNSLVEERTAQLENTLSELQKAQQFKDQFLANMSHEIRTPMNAVVGMTNLILNTPLEEKQKFYLERVKKASDNLLHIINDILDISKIEAGKMELEEIDMSLIEVVDQVRQTLLHKAEEKGLELFVKIDSDVPDIVIGDPVRLNQVLINLAGNAIKFTERGSVAIEVRVIESEVRFEVIDTGIGIEPDKLQSVFDSFSQANTSDTRKYGGTGLGLSISQQLVELMGGQIGIESVVDRGTTFYFQLQLGQGDAQRYSDVQTAPRNIDGSVLNGLKILVADDNDFNRIVAIDTLQSLADMDVLEAANGQEAVDLLDESVDLILMDVQMPILNGYDATRLIRVSENEKLRKVPILALTANVMRSEIDKCMDAGMNGFVSKPFRVQDLITSIAKVLNR